MQYDNDSIPAIFQEWHLSCRIYLLSGSTFKNTIDLTEYQPLNHFFCKCLTIYSTFTFSMYCNDHKLIFINEKKVIAFTIN